MSQHPKKGFQWETCCQRSKPKLRFGLKSLGLPNLAREKTVRKFFLNVVISPARLRLYSWLSLISQILIVVTGGAVRLTASGLGCPTWPKCTEDSWVNTPEMEIHGLIEFANRLLTFVLLVIAILTFAVAIRVRRQNRSIFWLAFGLGFGIILQAVIGGITVLTGLNPWIVGLHFLVSAVLISMATVLVYLRESREHSIVASRNPNTESALSWAISAAALITILVGIVVTGAGPHAGDLNTPRNGLDLEIWQHYHSWPGYVLLALLILALIWRIVEVGAKFADWRFRALMLTLLISVVQAAIGIIQSRLGVPAILVGLHMLGAAVLCSLVTWQQLTARTLVKKSR